MKIKKYNMKSNADLSTVGEFGLIKRLSDIINVRREDIKVGIGDDTAVIDIDKDNFLLLTTDTLIENIHFDLNFTTPYLLGWKAIAVNISDIAAMGGYPEYCLVSLGLPSKTTVNFVEEIYRGIKNICAKYNVAVVGGDTVKSPDVIYISITLTGRAKKKNLKRRDGTKIGDIIAVTGNLGDSAAGLELLRKKQKHNTLLPKIKKRFIDKLIKAHNQPLPQLLEAQVLSQMKVVTSMIDISDGLMGDIQRITESSKVGAEIKTERIPISDECSAVCDILGLNRIHFALRGGEDYKLLFTLKEEKAKMVLEKLYKRTGCESTIIGRIVSRKKGVTITYPDRRCEKISGGFNHFTT